MPLNFPKKTKEEGKQVITGAMPSKLISRHHPHQFVIQYKGDSEKSLPNTNYLIWNIDGKSLSEEAISTVAQVIAKQIIDGIDICLLQEVPEDKAKKLLREVRKKLAESNITIEDPEIRVHKKGLSIRSFHVSSRNGEKIFSSLSQKDFFKKYKPLDLPSDMVDPLRKLLTRKEGSADQDIGKQFLARFLTNNITGKVHLDINVHIYSDKKRNNSLYGNFIITEIITFIFEAKKYYPDLIVTIAGDFSNDIQALIRKLLVKEKNEDVSSSNPGVRNVKEFNSFYYRHVDENSTFTTIEATKQAPDTVAFVTHGAVIPQNGYKQLKELNDYAYWSSSKEEDEGLLQVEKINDHLGEKLEASIGLSGITLNQEDLDVLDEDNGSLSPINLKKHEVEEEPVVLEEETHRNIIVEKQLTLEEQEEQEEKRKELERRREKIKQKRLQIEQHRELLENQRKKDEIGLQVLPLEENNQDEEISSNISEPPDYQNFEQKEDELNVENDEFEPVPLVEEALAPVVEAPAPLPPPVNPDSEPKKEPEGLLIRNKEEQKPESKQNSKFTELTFEDYVSTLSKKHKDWDIVPVANSGFESCYEICVPKKNNEEAKIYLNYHQTEALLTCDFKKDKEQVIQVVKDLDVFKKDKDGKKVVEVDFSYAKLTDNAIAEIKSNLALLKSQNIKVQKYFVIERGRTLPQDELNARFAKYDEENSTIAKVLSSIFAPR